MSIDHQIEEALRYLVSLSLTGAYRAMDAAEMHDRRYNEKQDEWLNDFIERNAADPDEPTDEEHDELWNVGQETDEYKAFCDEIHDEVRDNLAAVYWLPPEALDHAITLLNHEHGASMLDARLAKSDPVAMAVETLLRLPLTTLIAALDAGEAVNEIADDELDEDDIANLAAHFRIDGPTTAAASIVVKAGQENAVLEHHEAFMDRVLDGVMHMLANLDAVTLDRTLAAQSAFHAALQTWCDGWIAPPDCAHIEYDPAYHAFVTATETVIEAEHGLSEERRAAGTIDQWIGRVGFDEVRVRFAERVIAEGRDPADPDMLYARAALAALPTDAGTVDRVIAVARAYGQAKAAWCLDWMFDERNAGTIALPEDQPAYAAFTERLLASIVAEHGVTDAQLRHAVSTGEQYIGHDNILARRWKRLAPRVAAVLN